MLLALGCLTGLPRRVAAQEPATLPEGVKVFTITLTDKSERKYALFVPRAYELDKARKWPLILSLHGSGECGDDGIKQTTVGLGPYLGRRAKDFPCIVVMPQAQAMWFRGREAGAAFEILADVQAKYRVDPDRLYLTGLSMGGFGTWEFAALRPDLFAAIVPVCGAGSPEYMSNLRNLPVWAFHGARDDRVPVAGSRGCIEALRKLGVKPKYTEYKDEGHFIWDRVYGTPALWKWLLEQRRQPAPRAIDYRMSAAMARVWWIAMQAAADIRTPPHFRAEVLDRGRVRIVSTGVRAWSILTDGFPLKPGEEIDVTWNGTNVYKGRFSGQLTIGPDSRPVDEPGTASRPATEPVPTPGEPHRP